MKDDLKRLLSITNGCRDDMHEPDEQGLKAVVVGSQLDNAFGERIKIEAIIGDYQELVVVLSRNNDKADGFNLATLIALARKAKL